MLGQIRIHIAIVAARGGRSCPLFRAVGADQFHGINFRPGTDTVCIDINFDLVAGDALGDRNGGFHRRLAARCRSLPEHAFRAVWHHGGDFRNGPWIVGFVNIDGSNFHRPVITHLKPLFAALDVSGSPGGRIVAAVIGVRRTDCLLVAPTEAFSRNHWPRA